MFKYPSSSERKQAIKQYPILENFGFKYISELGNVIAGEITIEKARRFEELYWWDYCLKNRFGKLQQSFVYAITSFNRGFNDDYFECNKAQATNHFMFDYYAETLTYYYISSRDVLLQIIRVYLELDYQEDEVKFSKEFVDSIKNQIIKRSLKKYWKETKQVILLRNAFAHRYTPTLDDLRIYREHSLRDGSIDLGNVRLANSKNLMNMVNDSIKSLSNLLVELKQEIKQAK